MIASDIGVPLVGIAFESTYALDGGSLIILKVSIILSVIGVPLYGIPALGSSFFSSWALDGGFLIILKVSMIASDIGVPLVGMSF